MTAPVVRFVNADTGEIKEYLTATGEVYADECEATSLNLALGLVPDLLAAIEEARAAGRSIEVTTDAFRKDGDPSPTWRLARLQGLAQALCEELDGDADVSVEVRACAASVRQALTKGDRP